MSDSFNSIPYLFTLHNEYYTRLPFMRNEHCEIIKLAIVSKFVFNSISSRLRGSGINHYVSLDDEWMLIRMDDANALMVQKIWDNKMKLSGPLYCWWPELKVGSFV